MCQLLVFGVTVLKVARYGKHWLADCVWLQLPLRHPLRPMLKSMTLGSGFLSGRTNSSIDCGSLNTSSSLRRREWVDRENTAGALIKQQKRTGQTVTGRVAHDEVVVVEMEMEMVVVCVCACVCVCVCVCVCARARMGGAGCR